MPTTSVVRTFNQADGKVLLQNPTISLRSLKVSSRRSHGLQRRHVVQEIGGEVLENVAAELPVESRPPRRHRERHHRQPMGVIGSFANATVGCDCVAREATSTRASRRNFRSRFVARHSSA